MRSMKRVGLAVALLAGVAGSALAAGFLTNGLPTIGAGGTYFAPTGVAGGNSYSNELGGYELLPADTGLASGAAPQSVAVTPFQVAAIGAALAQNTATATAGAATLNTTMGTVTSESLTTAAAASYTLTLTDSTVAATSNVQAAAYMKTSTAGALQIVSITPASGSVVIVVKNVGTAALNGTIAVMFQVK